MTTLRQATRQNPIITVGTVIVGLIVLVAVFAPLLAPVPADAGASQLSSAFRRSDLPELKKKVRDMALAAAKDKAKQTATALGIDLGRVVAVSENAGGSMWNATYFPQVANAMERNDVQGGTALGGTMQALTLDVSVGYQLSTKG